MKFVALMPMKGESERVPGKNIRSFNGMPLCLHMLKTLQKVDRISKIIINTDSEVIKDLLKNEEKVFIHDRPEELKGHTVPMNSILEYDMAKSEENHFIQTHSTNPLLKFSSLNEGIDKYIAGQPNFDSVFSVTRLQTRLYQKDGSALNHNPAELLRTQDLEPLFEENSNFYIFSKESFRNNNGNRIGLKPQMIEINRLEAMDIDEPEDFILAELTQKIDLHES